MSHSHSHELPKTLSNLIWTIVINIAIVIFEIILGIISNSLAIISDAFHNITDISSMILGYISEKISNLHIWSANSHLPILSVHLQIKNSVDLKNIFIKSKNILHNQYAIKRSTLQIVPAEIINNTNLDCTHCN